MNMNEAQKIFDDKFPAGVTVTFTDAQGGDWPTTYSFFAPRLMVVSDTVIQTFSIESGRDFRLAFSDVDVQDDRVVLPGASPGGSDVVLQPIPDVYVDRLAAMRSEEFGDDRLAFMREWEEKAST